MSGDFIPHQDGAFLNWAKTLTSYVAAHLTGFNIQEAALAPIQTLLADYQTTYDRAENPNRGKVDVLAKNEARDALKAARRTFIKAYLTYNPEVTDVDKESMGLPLHDSTRTPIPPPATVPETELDSSVIRQIAVHFKDKGIRTLGRNCKGDCAIKKYGILIGYSEARSAASQQVFYRATKNSVNF